MPPSSRKPTVKAPTVPQKIPSSQFTTILYHYRAHIVAVHDGDTCTADIDLGLMMWKHGETIRLARIDAPELTGTTAKRGVKSRDFLRSLIEGKDVVVATIRDKREKYGRYLGELWLLDGESYTNVNDTLVISGHAKYRSYR